jgi:hypothetical protein
MSGEHSFLEIESNGKDFLYSALYLILIAFWDPPVFLSSDRFCFHHHLLTICNFVRGCEAKFDSLETTYLLLVLGAMSTIDRGRLACCVDAAGRRGTNSTR